MLQSTLLFENCSQVRVPTAKFVQILNIHGNHWITLINIDCAQGAIRVFDSMSNGTGLQNNDKFNCQVASLFGSDTKNIKVINVNIKQQEGASDCGLFAIACATSLCFRMAPEDQHFPQEHMRNH